MATVTQVLGTSSTHRWTVHKAWPTTTIFYLTIGSDEFVLVIGFSPRPVFAPLWKRLSFLEKVQIKFLKLEKKLFGVAFRYRIDEKSLCF